MVVKLPRNKMAFFFGLGFGLILAGFLQLALHHLPANAVDGGGGATSKENGDINGDGNIDVTDAIALLTFLFLGGEDPAIVDCVPVAGGPARMRFFNDLNCGGQGFDATLEICGVSVQDFTDGEESDCAGLQESPSCAIEVTADTLCGAIAICSDVAVETGKVYDYVLTFDASVQALILIEYVQDVTAQDQCPNFPSVVATPNRILDTGCPAAGAGGAVISKARWSALRYGR